MEPRYEFARRMALRCLKRHRVTEPPVPVEYLLVMEGVGVELLDYPDETAGECWWEGEEAHIAVNRALPRTRLRFTLAHEWGHLELRHHQHPVHDLSFLGRRIKDEDAALEASPDPMEVEANTFASELLMPHGLFASDWHRRPNARWLATRYEVSDEAAWRRIQGLLQTRNRAG